jgi:hypothetical protein
MKCTYVCSQNHNETSEIRDIKKNNFIFQFLEIEI